MKPSPLIIAGVVGLGLALWSRAARAASYNIPQFSADEIALYLNADGTINLSPAFKPAENSDGGMGYELDPQSLSGLGEIMYVNYDSATDTYDWGYQQIKIDPVLIAEDDLTSAYELDIDGLFHAVADWLWQEEAYVGYVYDDATGKPWAQSQKGNPTIGVGHKLTDDDIRAHGYGWTVTKDGALELLRSDINKNLSYVLPRVTVPLTLKQWIAIASLAFNAGGPGIAKSQFLRAVNAGDMQNAELQFKDWNKSTVVENGAKVKRVNRGLTARREREWAIFSTPDKYVMLTKTPTAG